MKKLITLLTILYLFNSCKSENREKLREDNKNSTTFKYIDYENGFNKWLTKLGLERKMIIDTTSKRVFELWAYRDKLNKSDSTFYWHPSKDSSYYLITNLNRENNKRIISKYSNDIELKFLNKESQKLFIGITLLDSLKKRNIDFYWYDNNSFFFIENERKKGKEILTKLKMGIDSIWNYKIQK